MKKTSGIRTRIVPPRRMELRTRKTPPGRHQRSLNKRVVIRTLKIVTSRRITITVHPGRVGPRKPPLNRLRPRRRRLRTNPRRALMAVNLHAPRRRRKRNPRLLRPPTRNSKTTQHHRRPNPLPVVAFCTTFVRTSLRRPTRPIRMAANRRSPSRLCPEPVPRQRLPRPAAEEEHVPVPPSRNGLLRTCIAVNSDRLDRKVATI